MKLKPLRSAPGICRELTCEERQTGFGYCDEHRKELNADLERGAKSMKAVADAVAGRESDK